MTCFLIGFMDTGILCFWDSGVTSWFCGGGVNIVEIILLFPALLCS